MKFEDFCKNKQLEGQEKANFEEYVAGRLGINDSEVPIPDMSEDELIDYYLDWVDDDDSDFFSDEDY